MSKKRQTPEQMLMYLRHRCYDDGDCQIWIGSVVTKTRVAPVVEWQRKRYYARRLLLDLMGRKTAGMVVYDTCGEARCMNPAHLRVGSQGDALRAAAKRGAFPSGARRSLLSSLGRSPRARLGIRHANDVLRMRADGQTLAQIGAVYGVGWRAVSAAIKSWRRAGVTEWRAAA